MNNLASLAQIKQVHDFLSEEIKLVDHQIKSRIVSKVQIIPQLTDYILSAGGKRIRPILTLLSAKLFDYQGNDHINLASAVEFIHTATLLHDDVVDGSDIRRGRLSANCKWDNKSSILVGDFLFSQAFCLIAKVGIPKILQILSNTSSIIAEGEVMQISSKANLNINKDHYLQVINAKTAALFSAACEVGAIIAGRNNQDQQALHDFGKNLGVAFQIIDDLLDYNASQEILGKKIGDDFREAKVTLPIIIAYHMSNKDEKTFWHRVFEQQNQQIGDLEYALTILKKYKITQIVQEEVAFYITNAKLSLDMLPTTSDAKELLGNILDFSVSRLF